LSIPKNLQSIKTALLGPLEVTRGDNCTFEDTLVNIQTNEAVDITGATITLTVREKIDDASVVFTRSTGGSGIVVDSDQVANKGKYQVSIIPSNTSGKTLQTYEYDIQIVLNGKTQTISRDEFEILSDITT